MLGREDVGMAGGATGGGKGGGGAAHTPFPGGTVAGCPARHLSQRTRGRSETLEPKTKKTSLPVAKEKEGGGTAPAGKARGRPGGL